MQRGTAYAQQSARRRLDANMFKQLARTIRDLLEEDQDELESFFAEKGDARLLDFVQPLMEAVDAIIESPPAELGVL
jgi:hypothetical protein